MEAKKDNGGNSELFEKLVGNDYGTFLVLSMLSNHENGGRYLEVVKTIGLNPKEINFIFENVVSSDIEKMARMLSALARLGSSNIKKIAALTCNSDGKLDIRAFIIVTATAMTKYVENPVSETQALTGVTDMIERRGLRGQGIYDDYCSFAKKLMYARMDNGRAATADFADIITHDRYIFHLFVDEVVVDYIEESKKRAQLTDYIR